MVTGIVCRDCDKPLASSLDGLARTTGRTTSDQNALCWRAWHGDICQWPSVDWRARCLAMQPIMEAAERMLPDWNDTSGSFARIDAMNDHCDAIAKAVEAYRTEVKP